MASPFTRRMVQQPWVRRYRTFLTSAAPHSQRLSAKDAAAHMLHTFDNKEVSRLGFLDGNQLHKLALTLGRTPLGDTSEPRYEGTPVPPGHHLVYFTPNGREDELGLDGTDTSFNAPAPFTRRMWAGGKMSWPAAARWKRGDSVNLMETGMDVYETTRIVSATAKSSRSVGEMILVEVEKSFRFLDDDEPAVVDRRSWIFRPALDPTAKVEAPKKLDVDLRRPTEIVDLEIDGAPVRQFRWSPTGLFRFSALTFNGHKIHYNEDWSTQVEGHPGLVVHGPLNLINILDYWRDFYGAGGVPHEVTYRAVAPLYAGETYQIVTEGVRTADQYDGTRIWNINAVKNDGTVCMKSEVRGW